jgi:hypothetical protein
VGFLGDDFIIFAPKMGKILNFEENLFIYLFSQLRSIFKVLFTLGNSGTGHASYLLTLQRQSCPIFFKVGISF